MPLSIVNKAHQANQLYPFAMSLFESVRTYQQTLEKVEEKQSIHLLIAGLHKEVQNLIAEVRHYLLIAGLHKEVQNLIAEVRHYPELFPL